MPEAFPCGYWKENAGREGGRKGQSLFPPASAAVLVAVPGTRVPPPIAPSRISSSLQELSQLPFVLDTLARRVGTYQMELQGMDLMATDMREATEAAKVRATGAAFGLVSLCPALPPIPHSPCGCRWTWPRLKMS